MFTKRKSIQNYVLASLAFLSITFTSCKREFDPYLKTTVKPVVYYNDIVVPNGFTFNTTQRVSVNLGFYTNNDEPISGITVKILDASEANNGHVIKTVIIPSNGIASFVMDIPAFMSKVVIGNNFVGLPMEVEAPIVNNSINVKFGGKKQQKLQVIQPPTLHQHSQALHKSNPPFSYKLGGWDVNGLPNYLMGTRETFSTQFLLNLNASLPSGLSVPVYNPNYLNSSTRREVRVVTPTDVYVTYIADGAAYHNSLFYYIYNVNNKPTNASQIDSLYCVFPNTATTMRGGPINIGDKIKIGHFGADTVIAFALVTDSWVPTNHTISNGQFTFFSNEALNPENNSSNQQHVALLHDIQTDRFLLGFEDLNRDWGGDNDFNDIVIGITANHIYDLDTNDVVHTRIGTDIDGDGAVDPWDEYPTDPTRAYNNYYPSKTTFGTLAFEDLWPSRGDFDMNDVVVDYQYKYVVNSVNGVVDLHAKYYLRAAGGANSNGFAVEYPFNRSDVASINSPYTLESANSKASTIIFSDAKTLIPAYNTFKGRDLKLTDTFFVDMTLNTPQYFVAGTHNPFIYVNMPGYGRSHEIHLLNHPPTSLANRATLGTNADNSDVSQGRYYQTNTGLPFALELIEKFDYPAEGNQIIDAYPNFTSWAQNGGTQHTDWFRNYGNNRVPAKIY